ncbi:hypothetical protein EHQ43_06105 [Leptospira bouyouniensis]|uniref:Uncharacterized protein n=1 Tax=Leptospira bouyouniensis TaxID=2484911 RepID=A0A7I0HU63_9LEPT|nr:hypothetical protein [Leptospira bouyouniensis]TGL07501.1 hypothetical protein EHQ43_06105 [Leptospira bouyouniensis]
MAKQKKKETTNIFLISPIGKKGTDVYQKFKDSLDFIIKPAIENSNFELKLTRADEIQKPGSIISDIVNQIANSYIVIADLTDFNPNVFYELGVRHALSNRTILIAQSEEFIPFDLKDYRTIIYDNSAKGAKIFSDSLNSFIKEIFETPDLIDNPVLEKLKKRETKEIEHQITPISKKEKQNNLSERFERIARIDRLEAQRTYTKHSIYFDNGKKEFEIPGSEGSFRLFWKLDSNKETILNYYYISKNEEHINWDTLRSEIRLLIAETSDFPSDIKFILLTDKKITIRSKIELITSFNKLLSKIPSKRRKFYILDIWDDMFLKKWEKKEGIID